MSIFYLHGNTFIDIFLSWRDRLQVNKFISQIQNIKTALGTSIGLEDIVVRSALTKEEMKKATSTPPGLFINWYLIILPLDLNSFEVEVK